MPEHAQLGFFERGKGTQVRAQRLLELRYPARERHAAELAQPLLVVVDLPAPADLAIFQYPGVENGKKAHLLTFGFQIQDHLLRNLHAFAHGDETVRAVCFDPAHGGNVLAR